MRQTTSVNRFLQQHNPFALIHNNSYEWYRDECAAYKRTIELILHDAPFGFVDIPLFMVHHQGLKLHEAISLCGGTEYAILYYPRIFSSYSEKIRKILKIMLKRSDCEWNEIAFQYAILSIKNNTIKDVQ